MKSPTIYRSFQSLKELIFSMKGIMETVTGTLKGLMLTLGLVTIKLRPPMLSLGLVIITLGPLMLTLGLVMIKLVPPMLSLELVIITLDDVISAFKDTVSWHFYLFKLERGYFVWVLICNLIFTEQKTSNYANQIGVGFVHFSYFSCFLQSAREGRGQY
jgi:hypothetical protein